MMTRIFTLVLVLAASGCAAPVSGPESRAAGDRHANVSISHLPMTLWTVTEGVHADAASNPPDETAWSSAPVS
jgi:hypothetical protein